MSLNVSRPFLLQKDEVSGTFVSVVSVRSFPRVGHGVGQRSLIFSRNSGSTVKNHGADHNPVGVLIVADQPMPQAGDFGLGNIRVLLLEIL